MVLVVPPQQRQIVVPAAIPGRIAILVQALDFLLLRPHSADLFAHLPIIALAGHHVNHFAELSQQVAHAFSLLQWLPGQCILGAPVRGRPTMNQHSGDRVGRAGFGMVNPRQQQGIPFRRREPLQLRRMGSARRLGQLRHQRRRHALQLRAVGA